MADTTPPPAPTNVRVEGNTLSWEAEADLESGLASFIIERDGQFLANVPDKARTRSAGPIFQNLQYSDTPTQPLVPCSSPTRRPSREEAHLPRDRREHRRDPIGTPRREPESLIYAWPHQRLVSPAKFEDEMSEGSLVEVYRAKHSPQAHLLKSALENAGIRAVVEGDLLQGAVGEPGEWWAAPRIMVAECDA